MVRWKRLFYYLTINVLVSACTTVSVLYLWEKYNPPILDIANFSLEELSQAVLPVLQTPIFPFQATAEVLPASTPTPGIGDYLVVRGDTLSDIAERFGVGLEELMEMNNIENPNTLIVGQMLRVPLPVVEAIPTPALQAANIPAALPEDLEEAVVIVNVVGAGDLSTERVRLEFRGEGEHAMQGWTLQHESGKVFVFPQLTLFPRGAIDVYTKGGIDSVISLHWGMESPVWEGGDKAILSDNFGRERSTFIVP
jgi:LysM repeat protein